MIFKKKDIEANYHDRIKIIKTEQSAESSQFNGKYQEETTNRYKSNLKETER